MSDGLIDGKVYGISGGALGVMRGFIEWLLG